MKQWKCTVCGYIHKGETPPEECPVCGADSSKFVEITDEAPEEKPETGMPQPPEATPSASQRFYHTASEMLTRLHAHPISVHIPNGVLPVGVIFLMLAIFLNLPSLERASFYNLLAVVVSMPLVMLFGYIDWKNRYKGKMTSLFMSKIICGIIVTVVGLFLLIWRMIDPDVAGPASTHRLMYLCGHILMLAAAVFAGYLGGKLVFKK